LGFPVLGCEFSGSLRSSSRARNERGDLLLGVRISQEIELTQNRLLPRPAIAVLAMTTSFKALLLSKEEYPKGEVVCCLLLESSRFSVMIFQALYILHRERGTSAVIFSDILDSPLLGG